MSTGKNATEMERRVDFSFLGPSRRSSVKERLASANELRASAARSSERAPPLREFCMHLIRGGTEEGEKEEVRQEGNICI